MLDLLVTGGTVVDGTGAPARRADIGVADGRIVRLGAHLGTAATTIDAGGLVVCPGFVDVHTHYDAQLLWDPTASPSPLHGVTTILGGNCGFTIAPIAPQHVDYIRRMMARVEGMPLSALEGAWDWSTFGSWLDRLDGRVAVNAGFLVGHSTIRRVAMGAASGGPATAEQVAAMVAMVHEALGAGALGFSSSLGQAHTDGDGAPVPSRAADRDEILALCRAVRDHEGTTIEFIPAVGEIGAELADLMSDMSLAANRPLNWNLLGSLSPVEIYEGQLAASDVAAERGAVVVALTLPDLMRLRSDALLRSLPGWRDVVRLDGEARRRAVADPAIRRQLHDGVDTARARGLGAIADWDLVEVAEGRWAGCTVAAVGTALDVDPVDVLIDVVLPDNLPLTTVLPSLVPSLGATDEGWRRRVAVWKDPRVVLGGSDAGAHLDLMCHANYPTVVLGEVVRQRGLLSLEEAVRMMTDVPARLYGLRDRGRIEEGAHADLVVLDPDTVGSAPAHVRTDLPGGGYRLYAEAAGVSQVLVNGVSIVVEGTFTGAEPGTLLRSGRDTETRAVPGG